MTRQLLLFYQPTAEKDNFYLEQYISLLLSPISNRTSHLNEMFGINDKETLDSWIWLACLLIKKVLLQSIER
jgi:hypothetical protein